MEADDLSDAPSEVCLDPRLSRMALSYAIQNASAAAAGTPVKVRMRGGPDRWVTEIRVSRPGPYPIRSTTLTSTSFDRLCGNDKERRGMELAIAARVGELFGGTTRLDVDPSGATTVVLDWPARSAQESSAEKG